MHDQAVSEIIGSILMFGIMLAGIMIILLVGGGMLDATKSQNNFKGIEHGFTILYSDIEQAALEGTPVKTINIHMEDGSIMAKNASNKLTILVNGNSVYGQLTGNMTFKSNRDMSRISLENGGLWETYGGETDTCLLKPRIFYDEDTSTLFMNVIRLEGDPVAISGYATLNVQIRFNGTNVSSYTVNDNENVIIEFDTAYPGAWGRFFKEVNPQFEVSPDYYNNRVTITMQGIKKLIINEHRLNVSA